MANELYMYLPGQAQCPKCGGAAGGHLTAVAAMPARPMIALAVTCTACGVYNCVSTVGVSNASAIDIAAWGSHL
jgi:hypothetical protein